MALEARGIKELACTTHELNALNSRLKDAANDCMLLTEQVGFSELKSADSFQSVNLCK